jgi:hypothetical protein
VVAVKLAGPLIVRIRGIWHCWTLGVEGLGFTPSDALRAWRAELDRRRA